MTAPLRDISVNRDPGHGLSASAPEPGTSRQVFEGRSSIKNRSFSTRTMSAITSDTGKHQGRRIPTMGTVVWMLLIMDVLAFFLTGLAVEVSAGFLPTAWPRSFGYMFPLAVIMLGTLSLIDAHRIEVNERFWRVDTHVLSALVMATVVSLSCAHALGIWRPLNIIAMFGDSAVITAGGFTVLATLNRSLLRGWMAKAAAQASWLVIARHDCDGLEQFWADFRSYNPKGHLVFLAESGEAADGQHGRAPVASGTWRDLPDELTKSWSGIIVTDAAQLDDESVRAVMKARLSGTRVISLEKFYEQYWHRVPVFMLHNSWFALTRGFGILSNPVQTHLKRIIDIVLAGGLLLLASPLMVIVAIAVKCDSPGPVLYRQPRTGLGGRIFTCLKFRSMVANADRGPLYAGKNDARITRFGRFIRTCRIDELPQLINVLKGDMSFIGPRAMWTQIVANHEKEIPFFRLRHLVRPGLTGWAQVNFHYGGTSEDMRIKLEYDLWYIKHQSLLLDLWIVLRTVRVVLFGIGAQ
jgi:exopolysaccharide biosynthesis polyprenyl glycosylphosphotransferase